MKRGKKREKEEQNKLSSRFMRDTVRVSQKTSVETTSRALAELIIRFRCFSRRKVSRYRRAARTKLKKESPPSMAARELSYLPFGRADTRQSVTRISCLIYVYLLPLVQKRVLQYDPIFQSPVAETFLPTATRFVPVTAVKKLFDGLSQGRRWPLKTLAACTELSWLEMCDLPGLMEPALEYRNLNTEFSEFYKVLYFFRSLKFRSLF